MSRGRRPARPGRRPEAHRQVRRRSRPRPRRQGKGTDAGLSRGASPIAGGQRRLAAPRRHHHGRQRPLGVAPRAAAPARAPRGRQGRARDHRGVRATRRRGPDAVRVLERELAPSRRGSRASSWNCSSRRWTAKSTNSIATACACASSASSHALRDGAARAHASRPSRAPAANTRMTLLRRGRLRWPLGHRAGGARAGAARRGAASCDPRSNRRSGARGGARARRRARARPLHPHRRRAAHQQLPALEPRLHRAVFQRHAVARLRRRRTSSWRCSISARRQRRFGLHRRQVQPVASSMRTAASSRPCCSRCCSSALLLWLPPGVAVVLIALVVFCSARGSGRRFGGWNAHDARGRVCAR